MKTEIIIPSSGVIDLYDDLPISLNYNIADIREPEKRNADYSKTITAPGTDNNNKLLAHIFEIGTDRLFNPNHKTNAVIMVDKVPVMNGILRLARINSLDDKQIEYEFEFKGRLDDLFTSIKDKLITDINWSDLNHIWNSTNIINSWNATVGTGYVYPFIDYGIGILSATEREIISFRPATYAKEIWDRIFSYAGFQYVSNFLTTDFFKRLIIPHYNEKFVRSQAQIQNNIFHAHRSSNQSFTFTGFSAGNFNIAVTDTIKYNDDFTSPSSDAGNVYNTSTGKFTAAEAGVYTFVSYNTLKFQHNSTQQLLINGYVRVIKNGNTPVAYSQNIQPFNSFLPPAPSIYTATDIPSIWSGFLNTGETIEMQLYFQVQNPFNGTFPSVQTNYVATNSYLYNSLDPAYSYNSSLSFSQAVPQNLKMQDFVTSIIRRFNLYFEYDKDSPNKIHIEPRNDYYNTTVQDWSDKLDTSQDVLIEPMGALDSKRYIFKDKTDNDWLNQRYQSNFQQIEEESYGTRIINVDNDFLTDDYKVETIFAPTPQYSDTTSDRFYPKIIQVDSVTNAQTPITAQPRLLYYSGTKTCQNWILYNYGNSVSTSFIKYPHCGHIDDETNPTIDLCWGVPKEIYYIPPWAATYSNNNCYNRFWKQFIDEITDKNSSIVTAWFHLTPLEIALLDFRNIYRFGFQNYRLNKVYDYNPSQESLTKVEFIKTRDASPFVFQSKPAVGGTGGDFNTTEGVPGFPILLANTAGSATHSEGPGKLIAGTTNYVSPTASSGVVIIGPKNLIGDNVKTVTILESSGVVVLHDNTTILNSSGITTTGPNQLWIYNQLITSGDIYHLTHSDPCGLVMTVAQMQAMAAAGTIDPCEEYILSDAYSNWGPLKIRGRTSTQLEPQGTILISGTIFEVGYDLTYDQITHIYDERENNRFDNPSSGVNRGGNCIEEFPKLNDNYCNNKGNGTFIFLTSSGNCFIRGNNDMGVYTVVTMDGSSGSAYLQNSLLTGGPQIIINGSNIGSLRANDASTISLTNNSIISYCVIGEASVITLNASSMTNVEIDPSSTITLFYSTLNSSKILGGLSISFPPGSWTGNIDKNTGISTFETTFAVTAGAYSFVVGGVDYGFCGIFHSTTSGGTVNITSFTNASFGSQMNTKYVRIYASATDRINFVHDGNKIFNKSGLTVTLNANTTNTNNWVDYMIVTSGANTRAYEVNHFS